MNNNSMMIQLNYTQAVAQADELAMAAANVKQLSEEDVAKLITEISSCWEGDNATSFIAKVEKVKKNLIKTASDIEKAATAVRTMAKNIYDAEMAAQSLATVRTFN